MIEDVADDDALTAWARERLASFNVPGAWIQDEALPTGEVDRAALTVLAGS